MEMHQIRYFLAVAKELNFSKAADSCKVAQPSLSRAIKKLEDEFGGPLFHRERAHTHLSELGRMIKPHLEQVYEQAEIARSQARDFTGMKRTQLKLGIMSTIAPDQIVDLIVALRSRYKGIELRLCDASAQDLRRRLIDGDLEAVIYALPGEEPDERTHVLPLFRERMVIAVHRGHRLANESAFPVKEMNGESYIHRMNCEFAGYADRILADRGVICRPAYWSERDDWTLAMVSAGLGFGFLPSNSVTHPGVVGLPVVEPEFWRDVNLVSVRGRPHSPAVGALVREAMSKKWFGRAALAICEAAE